MSPDTLVKRNRETFCRGLLIYVTIFSFQEGSRGDRKEGGKRGRKPGRKASDKTDMKAKLGKKLLNLLPPVLFKRTRAHRRIQSVALTATDSRSVLIRSDCNRKRTSGGEIFSSATRSYSAT